MVLIDLQKAFDTIDHQILLKKMKYLGFSKNTITWFKSYLCERKFKISINISYSSPASLLCGIPQGSILGPLLFLLYINDFLQGAVSDSLLYADDACIDFQQKFSFFDISFFLRDHNGNKAVQVFSAITVAIDFLIVFRNSLTI